MKPLLIISILISFSMIAAAQKTVVRDISDWYKCKKNCDTVKEDIVRNGVTYTVQIVFDSTSGMDDAVARGIIKCDSGYTEETIIDLMMGKDTVNKFNCIWIPVKNELHHYATIKIYSNGRKIGDDQHGYYKKGGCFDSPEPSYYLNKALKPKNNIKYNIHK